MLASGDLCGESPAGSPCSSSSPAPCFGCCPRGQSDGRPHLPQDFHYRPKGSDTCLPCDCYPVGSSSRSCDNETGRCHCRPGVIGRQCNSCDSPFAEVTPSGCEGERGRGSGVLAPRGWARAAPP